MFCGNLVVSVDGVSIFILFCLDVLVTRNIFFVFCTFFCLDDITFIILEGSCNFFRIFFRSFFWFFSLIKMSYITGFRINFLFLIFVSWECRFWLIAVFFFQDDILTIFITDMFCSNLVVSMDSVSIFIFFCLDIFVTRNIFLIFCTFFCFDDITLIILESSCNLFRILILWICIICYWFFRNSFFIFKCYCLFS